MFDESKLPDVVRLLERRQASLWHACQLLDLAAYLRLGGIASRLALARSGLAHGSAQTDASDRILFHLDDIGHGFAAGWATIPALFGPITLQVVPTALTDASEAHFNLRSAASMSLEPQGDSLSDPRTVDELFWYEAGIGFPRSTWMRFGDHLQGNFGSRDASSIDVLVTPRRNGTIALSNVVAVWVEPVTIDGVQLIDLVSGLCDELGLPLRIRRRTMIDPARAAVWTDMGQLLRDGPLPLVQLVNRADASSAFRGWATEMGGGGRRAVWEQFAGRLHDGTLRAVGCAAASSTVSGPHGDAGFWSRSRRQPIPIDHAGPSRERVATLARPALRVCGHPVQDWDDGLCYACLSRARSAWRYPEDAPVRFG